MFGRVGVGGVLLADQQLDNRDAVNGGAGLGEEGEGGDGTTEGFAQALTIVGSVVIIKPARYGTRVTRVTGAE